MPCYSRLISLHGYRSRTHRVTQEVSEHSDVEFQNKSPPKIPIWDILQWFWIQFKGKCPVIPGSFHFRVIGHDPIGSPKKFQNILMWSFKIKAYQSFQYETYYMWFWIQFKRKWPVISGSFHYRVIVHDTIGSAKKFQNILTWSFKIKANQSFQYETYIIYDFGFNFIENALLFHAHFTSGL